MSDPDAPLLPLDEPQPRQRLLLVLSVLVLVLGIAVGGVWVLYRQSQAVVATMLTTELDALTRSASTTLATVADRDPERLQHLLRRIRDSHRLEQVLIVDPDGLLIADAAGTPPGTPVNLLRAAPDRLRAAQRSERGAEEILDVAGLVFRRAYHQLDARPAILVLEIHDPLPALEAALRRPFVTTLIACVACALLAALGLALVLRHRQRQEQHLRRMAGLALGGTVASSMAHEVRNPLQSIQVASEVLLRDPALGVEQRRLLEDIQAEVERADDQVAGFLDLVRSPPLRREPLDLRTLVRGAADLLQARARDQNIAWRVDCPSEAVMVEVDRRRLHQVLVNLLVNALQAMPEPGTITISLIATEGTARLEIADQGSGIATAERDRLFEPFYTTKPNGTGLGLPLARRTLRRHGGDLDLRPRPGRGSVATVTLPLAPHPESGPCAS